MQFDDSLGVTKRPDLLTSFVTAAVLAGTLVGIGKAWSSAVDENTKLARWYREQPQKVAWLKGALCKTRGKREPGEENKAGFSLICQRMPDDSQTILAMKPRTSEKAMVPVANFYVSGEIGAAMQTWTCPYKDRIVSRVVPNWGEARKGRTAFENMGSYLAWISCANVQKLEPEIKPYRPPITPFASTGKLTRTQPSYP